MSRGLWKGAWHIAAGRALTIGPIEQRRVLALVTEEGALDTSLLGLNFLSALSSYTVSGNQMILTP